ncbi:prepilin-type N-terminal cleavage/methylation domain-containing protein [Thaumasiovibrio subtropicus]|uniref:prepilin-type N-terminal cleavage/methylation domain-containing protein n=1 Tax=Thaumasiovibrio subtropicus TaxID=1891207 RepID=UPI000B34E5A7|nr:prepilin-type N-terminal cleavage/methylation domain-containing protein [Thaumasiovibrio subtropicus]
MSVKTSDMKQSGFTLIESVVAIVTLSFAMLVLSQLLFPQVEKSAIPYYQARASALGSAVMGEVMARMFDKGSDPTSVYRCGESTFVCYSPSNFGTSSSVSATNFTSVDSYLLNDGAGVELGCWGDTELCSPNTSRGDITALLPGASESEYSNFAVLIDVYYEAYTAGSGFSGIESATVTEHKRVTVSVLTSEYGQYDFIAYRSNY